MFWSVSFSVSHCISASRLLAMTNLGNKRYRLFLRSERRLAGYKLSEAQVFSRIFLSVRIML